MRDVNVTSLFVVVATVVVATSNSGPLLCIGSHKVDVLVRVDLRLLQGGQLRSVQPQSLVRGERTTHLAAVASDSLRAGGFSGAFAGFSAVIDTQFIKKRILFFPPNTSSSWSSPHLSTLCSLDRLGTRAGLLGG